MATDHDHEEGVAPPTNDAYTGMLSISLLALVGSCVLLYLDYSRYPDANPPPLQKFIPDKKAPEMIQAKEFRVVPGSANMVPGQEKLFSVNGKLDSAESDSKDVTTAVVDEQRFKVMIGAEPMDVAATITVKSKDEKTATLKINIKKE